MNTPSITAPEAVARILTAIAATDTEADALVAEFAGYLTRPLNAA